MNCFSVACLSRFVIILNKLIREDFFFFDRVSEMELY